jgi:hypothetical protein
LQLAEVVSAPLSVVAQARRGKAKAPRGAWLLQVSFRGHQEMMLIRVPCPGGSGCGGGGAVVEVLESSCVLASAGWVWAGAGDGGSGKGGGVGTLEMFIGTILSWISC